MKLKVFVRRSLGEGGFTLIELLVVIAIIGLLSSVVLVNLSQARSRARDGVRRASLKQMQQALELYFSDKGQYPCSNATGDCTKINWMSSEAGDNEAVTSAPGAYIPGLVSKYIDKLPSDPKGGDSYCGGGWKSSFLYMSDGADYTLLSNCAPEKTWTSSDPYYDTTRPNWAWRVSTPGSYAKGW